MTNAIVTGASRGIGREIARQLAARGVRLALHYQKNRTAAESLLAELPGEGHALFAADLGDSDAPETLIHAVLAQLGQIDILVNNAGIYHHHPPQTTSYADWRKAWTETLAVNLFAPAHLSFLAAAAMPRGGRIVNISSRGAFRGEPEAPAYGASKAGLNALSQSLARAFAAQGICCYCLAPGWVETEMAASHLAGPRGAEIIAQHPLGRVTQPEEIARAAVFCALDAPAAMTGSIIDLNGASYLRT
ncbi:MAG: short-chain dehydrogenase/reductase [Verrucomicrobia bacterium]|nr:short-chain dehydrogenase/reductase [Verrucomicrobiota bacterium]